ncbi:bifunctional 5,10-methylenetetrahydrofolate dehydrogenase/5,10-methenyltetrahydrofolate cyclohydrolase [Mycoplasma struthionis]|uniref:Bifunctional protein FolD n=1 Tax=Mycoplasma struthionis TaxID=538220 RepID=A0A3G8LIW5_9MOLU|nr:bifunctional 5,10-methylenetetrahydrofolate dehydrogenase/5,10-methenyltetrahydrofolate cyclohydrolase [Mycoplasma struthionis]AZG68820.1 bifunctional 5,10-methylenetetrahydrofolate dehydrogenase/5,10-methenyltetrahydrofolate cyclohydrolase [Mycoplasma struthionis]
MTILLDGKQYSKELKEKIKIILSEQAYDDMPVLGILQVGNLEESNIYIKYKLKMASELGFKTEFIKLQENADEKTIKDEILKLNKITDGFIIQLPMQSNQIKDPQALLNLIDPLKDIDGLNEKNHFKNSNESHYLSATPNGIILLLNKYKIKLKNKSIAVLGQSKIVGYPLANYLENLDNTIYRYTKNTSKNNLDKCEIVIVATGQRNCILANQIKENAIIVDVGIHRLENNKIVGDLDFDEFYKKASYITPVPGGVGPMTIISLMLNLLKAKALSSSIFNEIIFKKIENLLNN